ncbi:MAG: phage tail sheath family protein [Deltaproteobacteria bacterium]|nr:phage tail sheath family protein [Deltaproteobacteria bacterium]
MPEYLSPGVYVEEVNAGPRPIEGVSTSTAGFVGATERGPTEARLVTSWSDFLRWYGGYVPDVSYLPHAIQGFFDNGGQRCFVARVVGDQAGTAVGSIGTLNVFASGHGTWGNKIMVKVSDASQVGRPWSRVSILYFKNPPAPADFVDPTSSKPEDLANPKRREPDVLEVFDNLTHLGGASNNVATVLNASSRLVRVEWSGAAQKLPNQDFAALATQGNDGAALTAAEYIGDLSKPVDKLTGLAALESIDEISLLSVPDEVRQGLSTITDEVINQCERLHDRFGIISTTQGQSDAGHVARPGRDTSYAGFYYPWIEIFDTSINDTRLIPPSGHVTGIFARTDIERGVHKAPANEIVRGARDIEFPVPKGVQDILNPKGINCIRDFRPSLRGIRLWGARTLSSDGQWKYVNVRRLFLFVEESIDEGTQWVVFEPNDEPTWAAVRRSISNFLERVWRSGALFGATKEEAFFVKCDRTTMTQDDIDNGRLVCLIGICPVKPAEFVIFRISQKTAEAQA